MSMMISELYDALKSAGADEDKARDAASAVARFDDRFNKIEAEFMLLKWMVAFNLAFTMAVLWKIFS